MLWAGLQDQPELEPERGGALRCGPASSGIRWFTPAVLCAGLFYLRLEFPSQCSLFAQK